MHTMHGMNTLNRFCNKQEALSKPLQVKIRKLPERPGGFGALVSWTFEHEKSKSLELINSNDLRQEFETEKKLTVYVLTKQAFIKK